MVTVTVECPEQLLDCHYVHSPIHQTGSKSVPQRMPRHAFDPRLLARESEARLEINERFAGFWIVENELVLPSRAQNSKIRRTSQSMGTIQVFWVFGENMLIEPLSRSTFCQRREKISQGFR